VHTPEESSRPCDVVQLAQQIANAATNREDHTVSVGVITICDVDLPFFISSGEFYVQAPLQSILDAVSASLVDFLRDLETRISETRSAALASTDFLPQIHVEGMVVEHVVRDSGEQR